MFSLGKFIAPVVWPGRAKRVAALGGFLAGVVALPLILISCSTVGRVVVPPPEIEGATFTGNQSCADCHAGYTRTFAASPHARLHVETARLAGGSGCP